MDGVVNISNGSLEFKTGADDCIFNSFVLPYLPFLINQERYILVLCVVCVHLVVYSCIVDLCHAVHAQLLHLLDSCVIVHSCSLLIVMASADILMLRDVVAGSDGYLQLV